MLSRPPKKNDKSYPRASPAWLGLGRPRGDGTGGASGMMRQQHRTRGGGLLGLVGGGDSGRTRRGGGALEVKEEVEHHRGQSSGQPWGAQRVESRTTCPSVIG
jgi:hypothetical protein